MKNDKIYCLNCNKISVDICDCKQQNTRFGFKALCPHCLSTNTININLTILQYEEQHKFDPLRNNEDYYRRLEMLYRDIQKALKVEKHLNSMKNKIYKR